MQAQPTAATRHFSGTYAEARAKFLDAAAQRGAAIESVRASRCTGAKHSAKNSPPTWR
jgi:hypothetical protein